MTYRQESKSLKMQSCIHANQKYIYADTNDPDDLPMLDEIFDGWTKGKVVLMNMGERHYFKAKFPLLEGKPLREVPFEDWLDEYMNESMTVLCDADSPEEYFE